MEQEPQDNHPRWETAKGVGACALFAVFGGILGGVGIEVTQDPEHVNAVGVLITDAAAIGFAAGAVMEWRRLWHD